MLSPLAWNGVDERIIEPFARAGGRVPWRPLVPVDQGDLLLFVFLLAGICGGFVLGYYWRELFGARPVAGREREPGADA